MINIAIIGTGNINGFHIPAIQTFPERCKIVALVDIVPEKAAEKKESYGLHEAEVFASHEEMIKSGIKVDLAHICTPPYVHASIAIDCMNAGINVLVEKPMATCLAECDAMLEAEKRNGVQMHVIAQNRFRNQHWKLKKLVESGTAGKIRVAHINSFWWRGHSYYDLWWRGAWETEGGGPTLNHAVHHMDLLNWIQDDLPFELTAVLANVMHDNSEVEDISFAILKYKDGSVANVTSSVVHHGSRQNVELQCEFAGIYAPFDVVSSKSLQNGFPIENKELEEEITKLYESIPDLKYEGHTAQVDDVLTALETGKPALIDGISGRRTIELITAIYKSGFEKERVSLPITSNDEYYRFEGIPLNAIYFHKKTTSKMDLGNEDISV